MLSITLGFRKGYKEPLIITSLWHWRPSVFLKSCCNHDPDAITSEMPSLSFISLNLSFISLPRIHGTEKDIFINRNIVTL